LIWIIQWVYIEAAFALVVCSPEVESIAREYFFIRVWAAPATLSLMVFKGWFIGMQNTVLPMAVDITVNVLNVVISYILAVHTPMGVAGVAAGTVVAQYGGLLLAIILMHSNFREYFHLISVRASIKLNKMKRFFSINGNLFIRSLCMLVIYIGFTSIAAKYGDTLLAVSSVMMKLLLLYSYFVDGFAYAGEALVGRFIGERNSDSLISTVRRIFIWCFGISIASTLIYAGLGKPMFRLMTDNPAVVEASTPFLFWLLLMPVVSCIAFTWDGIFIGATATHHLRNSMIWSAALFVVTYIVFEPLLGIQSLYLAYFVHLLVRSLYLTIVRKGALTVK
jgi:MATE family multidrug resistance protein